MEITVHPAYLCKKPIAFLIPCYNHESYISECLDSILMQELSVPYDILVCDDGSTDRSPAILKDYASKYPDKIKVIFLERNTGNLHAQNVLFSHVQSKYFLLAGSDDYLLDKHWIQEAFDFLESHPGFTVCAGNGCIVQNGKVMGNMFSKSVLDLSFSFKEVHSLYTYLLPQSFALEWNVVFNRGLPKEFIEAENTVDDLVYRGEGLQLLLHIEKGNIFFRKKNVYVRRVQSNGIWAGKPKLTCQLRNIYFYLCLANIFKEQKLYYQSLFFWNFSKILRAIYKNRNRPHFLRQEDIDLLKEIFSRLPKADFDWNQCKWQSNVIVKCFQKFRTYSILFIRQFHRILTKKTFMVRK